MTGTLAVIEPYQVRSTRYVQIVKLAQRQANVPIYLEQSGRAYLALWPLTTTESNYQASLADRDNNGIQAVCFQEKAGMTEVPVKGWQIESPLTGEYALTIESRNNAGQYALVVNTYSNLALECSLPSTSMFSREQITFSAKLTDGQQMPGNARVMVYLSRPGSDQRQQIALNDNGKDGDASANDGIYSCRRQIGVTAATEPGCWFAQFSADGTSGTHRFRRTAGLYFQHAIPGGSILAAIDEYRWSGDDNQRYLALKVPVRIHQPGRYQLSGIIAKGKQNIAWAKETRQFDRGISYCFLVFPEPEDSQNSATSDPLLAQMQLVSLERMELAGPRRDYRINSN